MFHRQEYWLSFNEVMQHPNYINGNILSSTQLLPYVQKLGNDLVVAEIGVAFGLNMINTIDKCSVKKYIAIDPFDAYQDWADDAAYGNMPRDLMVNVGNKFRENLSQYEKKNIVEFINKKSDDAKDLIEDNSLDYIFIDGNHARKFVRNDCINYWSKVKKNGIMSGHDWDGETVRQGVKDFMEYYNIPDNELQVVNNVGTPPCWMIYKHI